MLNSSFLLSRANITSHFRSSFIHSSGRRPPSLLLILYRNTYSPPNSRAQVKTAATTPLLAGAEIAPDLSHVDLQVIFDSLSAAQVDISPEKVARTGRCRHRQGRT
ncbi:unnamed protein product [Cuscuta epithymum]|uniref:Uncharacterized protein n=1 Tax=Cuscuta epithymum TaxID=186058 RepID=A0AAV0CKR9_9ASTE|nr:unnamed protein product [Cuscuta epithymum]